MLKWCFLHLYQIVFLGLKFNYTTLTIFVFCFWINNKSVRVKLQLKTNKSHVSYVSECNEGYICASLWMYSVTDVYQIAAFGGNFDLFVFNIKIKGTVFAWISRCSHRTTVWSSSTWNLVSRMLFWTIKIELYFTSIDV